MKPMAILFLCSIALCACAQEPTSLKLTKTIPLPGVKGRFDHFAIDAKGRRLFLAALGNNTLEVLDIAAGKMIKSIADLHKPTGVIYYSGSNEIGVANGDDGTFQVFDGTAYSLVRKLGSLDDADNVRVDSRTKLTYIGYGAGALAVLDGASMKQIGIIKLPAHHLRQWNRNSAISRALEVVTTHRERRANRLSRESGGIDFDPVRALAFDNRSGGNGPVVDARDSRRAAGRVRSERQRLIDCNSRRTTDFNRRTNRANGRTGIHQHSDR